MKKPLILVIAIFTIPLVEALTLFGEELSMLVLIPLIIIILFLLIFAFLIIKNKIKNKSASSDTESGIAPLPPPPGESAQELPLVAEPPPGEQPLAEPPIEKPSTEKEPIQSIGEEQQKPKTDYLKEVEELQERLPSISIKEANKQLNESIKRFFSDYAKINYKFTFEELEKELKKRKKKIICFPDKFSLINYSQSGLSKENLIELIKEFKGIIRFAKKESHPITLEFEKEIEEKKRKINILLEKGENSVEKDRNKAIGYYKKISEIYNSLTDKEKSSIKPSIITFYNKLEI